ncbi:uncharacterized protein LOC134239121 isoform X1 [Saccostrea cucullata]|uniref:uncharacterized protein LOC134239121 isoform X1 n=1 Tax=Saccostrea cuccullata TaxID=36930 RepID=UPI002ED1212D
MGTLKGNLLSPTSQHWSALRTDDDIQKAVSEFLDEESPKLHGKSFQEGIIEISHWLGSMIQQEREGWAYKVRMAMQEIESHRREALKIQGVLNQCAEQLHIISECCNMDKDKLLKIADKEPKYALPLYIECLTDLINYLVEDRIQCVELLRRKENDNSSLCEMIKEHIQKEVLITQQSFSSLSQRVTDLEALNNSLTAENLKLKKLLMRKNDEAERFHKHRQAQEEFRHEKVELFDKKPKFSHLPPIERSSPSSMQTASSPDSVIPISEEKLHKIRHSAKKLENSLQDALTQMDSYRKGSQGSMKYSHASMISNNFKLKPLLPNGEEETPENDKFVTWAQSKMEVSGKTSESPREKVVKSSLDQVKEVRKRSKQILYSDSRIRQEERESRRVERIYPNESKKACTFRSLVRSLDEMRQRKISKAKGGKVSKCLRCQKLFTLNDNHKKACCYHPRTKERVEEYNSKGKLQRVTYVWQCCQQGIDSQGCIYGQHI